MLEKLKKVVRMLPKNHSLSEAACYASFVYGHHESDIVNILPRFASKVMSTRTPLHMVCYIDSDRPTSYHTVAVRGTAGLNDHWYDGLRHAVSGNGITDYQQDAYKTLKLYLLENRSFPLVLTGHSMGAKIIDMFLAQLYVDRCSKDVKIKRLGLEILSRIQAIYCFDSPGTYPMLVQFFKAKFQSDAPIHMKQFLSLRKQIVVEVVGHPNSVNMCHQHAGEVYFLPCYDGVYAQRLYTLLQGDYTDALLQKHSIDGIARAIVNKLPMVKVSMWGGVSDLHPEASLNRLNNFAISYSNYRRHIAKNNPTLFNSAFSWTVSTVFSNIDRCHIDPTHPVMRAAKEVDHALPYSSGRLFYRLRRSLAWVAKHLPSTYLLPSSKVIIPDSINNDQPKNQTYPNVSNDGI